MQVAIVTNGQVTKIGDYKTVFSNTSFPAGGPSDGFLEESGAMRVNLFKAHDRATEKLVPAEPYIEDGWVYTVQVAAKTQNEIDADTQSKAAQLRATRDRLLAASDWRVIKAIELGQQLAPEWAAYRQALRDITAQPGFPNVDLPHDPDWVEPVKVP